MAEETRRGREELIYPLQAIYVCRPMNGLDPPPLLSCLLAPPRTSSPCHVPLLCHGMPCAQIESCLCFAYRNMEHSTVATPQISVHKYLQVDPQRSSGGSRSCVAHIVLRMRNVSAQYKYLRGSHHKRCCRCCTCRTEYCCVH